MVNNSFSFICYTWKWNSISICETINFKPPPCCSVDWFNLPGLTRDPFGKYTNKYNWRTQNLLEFGYLFGGCALCFPPVIISKMPTNESHTCIIQNICNSFFFFDTYSFTGTKPSYCTIRAEKVLTHLHLTLPHPPSHDNKYPNQTCFYGCNNSTSIIHYYSMQLWSNLCSLNKASPSHPIPRYQRPQAGD